MPASSESSERFSVTPRWNWKSISVGLVLLAILINLGGWQLDRAEEKRQLVSSIEQQQSRPAVVLSELSGQRFNKILPYRQVILTGKFDADHYWLVDNKIHQGKVGYEVIAPFLSKEGMVVLVNRGWVQAPLHREVLPEVKFPKSEIEIQGRFVPATLNRMVRNIESRESEGQWPIRIQQLSVSVAAQKLAEEMAIKTPIPEDILQLSPSDSSALVMVWRDINVSADKHFGYAVQWFSMAGVLVIALIIANTNIYQLIFRSPMLNQRPPSEVDDEKYKDNNKVMLPKEEVFDEH